MKKQYVIQNLFKEVKSEAKRPDPLLSMFYY